ncbi:hypothetical protein J6W34_04840 [bacterium]|nr:hypothetical protein [bacterium]
MIFVINSCPVCELIPPKFETLLLINEANKFTKAALLLYGTVQVEGNI